MLDCVGLPPSDLVLILERDCAPTRLGLRLSACEDAPRVHLEHQRTRAHEGPLGPFFRELKRVLVGAELTRIAQVRGDRLVALEFRSGSLERAHTLLAELTGRHANLVWMDADDQIVAVLQAHPPRLLAGQRWSPPPGKTAAPSGPALAEALPTPSAAPERWQGLAPLSWQVESCLGAQAQSAHQRREQRVLEERVQRKLERAQSLLKGLEARLEASSRVEECEREAELLKTNLARVQRGMRTLLVEDYYQEGAPQRELTLDPKLSAQENLQRAFERTKKLARAHELVRGEIELARSRIAALEAALESARHSEDPAALDAQLVAQGWLDARQSAPANTKEPAAPRLPYRVFTGLHGAQIRVGRSAADNDALSLKHSRGNDVWLHTADSPGSHVVLVLAGKSEADPEDLLDAAHLAVHFSPLRGAQRAKLHLARCKEVHKPRGAKPGLVHLSGGKTWELRLQPGRLERLLGSARGPGSEA